MGKTAGATGASGVRRQAWREIDDVMAFAVMHALSMVVITDARGAIEYVNKKFCEVTGYADDVTVLRRGRMVLTTRVADTTPALLAESMVGEASEAAASEEKVPVKITLLKVRK